ncbi:hypothetical protein BVG16_04495 [Paenibacillus selenitireducens]|uniref:Uncharacterized protein n=1 Tax=Paenibacillus selenitireducens TaxID=1324314 RepID=A0A1T2XJX1_9BACL|nr:hypothetical protein [Paenibacillus selenitireducens]OPA80016.1 hypothetical protein BVG16_04495 [Paenibacillus selenitireducens]
MNGSDREQKRVRLKQFLKILSEDPTLLNQDGQKEMRPLSELLIVSGYRQCDETVDMSQLLSLLLRKVGLTSGSEDMMEYMMNGGKVEDFMNPVDHAIHRLDFEDSV